MSTLLDKKYTREEIYEGMKIQSRKQLDDIYDTWIILFKASEKDEEYTIGFIGAETNTESDELLRNYITCPVFNDSIDLAEDIYYEE